MPSRENGSIRVLHVVGGMERGGIETWLMHVLRHIDRERIHIDFLVHTNEPCLFDDEVRALGSRIIPCMHPSQPWSYAWNFKRIMREHGPYDVVHSHVAHYSGYVLYLARQAGVGIRIAHSHNSDTLRIQAGFLRRRYLSLMKRWIENNATVGLAVSQTAARALFGPGWETNERWQVLYCGVDLTSFKRASISKNVRTELNIPPDALVIGHVGRFTEVKNHNFLVEIAAEVAKRQPNLHLLLAGDGPLRPAIEQKIAQVGLAEKATVGPQSEIARLMLGAMDVFVLPSLSEGLPLVTVEAQTAGLPLILSDVITEEVDELKPLVQRMSLSQPAAAWAEAILATQNGAAAVNRSQALEIMENSKFNIETNIEMLKQIYRLEKEAEVCEL